MNEQMPDAFREGADAAEEAVKNSGTHPPGEPGGDLGASGNEPLLRPDQGGQEGQPRQPRPDEVEPGEPLGSPDDPAAPPKPGATDDPSSLRGGPGEDTM